MDILEKLKVLTSAAKYDVACTSSGVNRKNTTNSLGNAAVSGICHSFSADGRCISLLKILFTNVCIYDCTYCVNRSSNSIPRASFTPEEIADLTMNFYRRNYIEGLFLSSGIIQSPNYTTELLLKALILLREQYHFNGYIHVKAIPGADNSLLQKLGALADRMSVNIELPSQKSLELLAPDKSKHAIFAPMGYIANGIHERQNALVKYRKTPKFVPAGQSTQMIVGATPETDRQILTLSESLYHNYALKRVFYSAYMPVSTSPLLPSLETKPPLLREHRLYQADWLLRFYGFQAEELLDESAPNFSPVLDPKCHWALKHPEFFPLDVNKATLQQLLRVPGIGPTSARRILAARINGQLDFSILKKIGVVMKRAKYFLLSAGKTLAETNPPSERILRALLSDKSIHILDNAFYRQPSLFPENAVTEEAILCLKEQL